MNEKPAQELLPPVGIGPESISGWFDWLTDPLPRRFMLPATGLLIMGLDWLLFSEEAATLLIAVPFTSTFGFLAGSIGTYYLQTRHGLDPKPASRLSRRHSISTRRHAGRRLDRGDFWPGRPSLAAHQRSPVGAQTRVGYGFPPDSRRFASLPPAGCVT